MHFSISTFVCDVLEILIFSILESNSPTGAAGGGGGGTETDSTTTSGSGTGARVTGSTGG